MASSLAYDRKLFEDCARRWNLTRIELFGSWARGDSRPDSDVDLLLTFARDARWTLFDLVNLKEELEAIIGRRVDLIENGSVNNPFLLKSILANREVLYAA